MSHEPDVIYQASDNLFLRRLGVDLSGPEAPDTMRAIIARVASLRGYAVTDLRGPSRVKGVSQARQEAMWLMHKTRRYSRGQIARFLGGRDHTTIIHGCRAHEQRMAEDLASWNALGEPEAA